MTSSCEMFQNHEIPRKFSDQEFCNRMKKYDTCSAVLLNNHNTSESSNICQEEEMTKLTQNCTISNLSTKIGSNRDENTDGQCDATSIVPSGDYQLFSKESAGRSNSSSRELLIGVEDDIGISDEKGCSRVEVNVDIFRLHSKCTYTLLEVGRSIMLTVIKHHLNDGNFNDFNAALVSNRKDTPALPRIDKLEEHFKNKDVLFLYHVITFTKFIPSPKNGWGKHVDASSITPSDDLERIRQLRNKMFHDLTTFSESVLLRNWCDLVYLVKRIDQEYKTSFHQFTRSLDDCCDSMQSANIGSTEYDPFIELDRHVKEVNISKEVSEAFKETIMRIPRLRDKVLYVKSFKSQTKNEKETNSTKRGRRTKSLLFECTWYEEVEEDGNQDYALEIQSQMNDNVEDEVLHTLHKITNKRGAENRRFPLEVSTSCHITDSREGSLTLLIKCKDANSKADLKRKLENGSIGIVLKNLLQFACLEMQIDNVDDIEVKLQKQGNRNDSFAVKDCPHLEFLAKYENLILEELCPSTMIKCLEQKEIDVMAVRQAIDEYPDDRLYHVSCLLATLVKAGEEACAVFKSCLDGTGHAYINAEWNRLQTATAKEKFETYKDPSHSYLSWKQDPNLTDDVIHKDMQSGERRLHGIAVGCHADVVKLLIEYGADVNSKDKYDLSPVHTAAMGGHTDVLRLLIESGAKVNTMDLVGVRPLQKAAVGGHTDVVRLLVESGADVNMPDRSGILPLHRATAMGHIDVVRLLLESGADVNTTDERNFIVPKRLDI